MEGGVSPRPLLFKSQPSWWNMIWSKEALQNLSEGDFCLKVLIPLFRAMGYKDVRYYHGGVLEQGKDIVMWKPDELRGRINYAVVVKAEKITGSASIASVVALQAQQALGSTFVDEQTNVTHPVQEVIVVTSREITKEGHEALRTAWGGAQVERHITKIAGDNLWELVERYLPHEASFANLSDAHKALNDSDPNYGYVTQLGPNRVNVVVFPKRGEAEPVPLSFEPRFPDTPEGKEQESAFRRFLASGRPAEVKAEYMTITGLPEPIQRIVQESPEGTFSFGPRKSSKNFVISLSVERPDGQEENLFPLIEFGSNYGGEEEILLSNEQQPIPYKFWLTIPTAERSINFRFDFSDAMYSAGSYLRAIEFELALSRGARVVFREYETGRLFAVSSVLPGSVESPDAGFVDMMRKLVWIQEQLRVVVPLPEREFFSAEDVEDILNIENVIRCGRFLGDVSDVVVELAPGALPEILSKHPDGVLGEMELIKEYDCELLGAEILLGAVELASKNVRIDPVQLEELKEGAKLHPDFSPSVRLIPEEGSFDAKFKDWPKVSRYDVNPNLAELHLPVSTAAGGLAPGFSNLQDAIAAADLASDLRQTR